MRIATWNINSVRMRMELLLRLIDETQPDVICLQETKVVDADFPLAPLAEKGYVHAHVHGMKSYNGVAILSKLPFVSRDVQHWCKKQDCRHALAELPGGIELHSVYIPAGGDIPDPEQNDKFAHKLQFVDEMTEWWTTHRSPERRMVMVGDLNIAPLEHDVWNHKELLKIVSHTPIEVEKLTAMQRSIGWVDAVRHFVPETEKLYTWWSYRAKDWAASNRGRRLDHVWVTPPLKDALQGHQILRDARGWEPKPSDHVPVIVDLNI
ncbi:exodeoxyribonuclease III [Azospirillum sp. sgz302134]